MKMQLLLLSVLIGGGLGAAMGHFGKCSSGGCPLTANWWRGAIYGAVLGAVFGSTPARHLAGGSHRPTPNITQVTESEFGPAVVQSGGPVVVDFYATWCGPCKVLAPILDELAEPLTNRVKFVKVDIDQAATLAARYGVEAVPTLVFLRDGQVVDKLVGVPAREMLQRRLEVLAAGVGVAAKAQSDGRSP